MSPYPTYHLYQSERPRSGAEAREVDALLGQMALTAHLMGRRAAWPARLLASRIRRAERPGAPSSSGGTHRVSR